MQQMLQTGMAHVGHTAVDGMIFTHIQVQVAFVTSTHFGHI
jgi:hypothetical protein